MAEVVVKMLMALCLALGGASWPDGHELPPHQRLTMDPGWCGPRLLYFFACLAGVRTTFDDVVRSCQADEYGYVSLARLTEVAGNLGLGPVLIKDSPAALLALDGPAILCVAMPVEEQIGNSKRRLHFIALVRSGQDASWILDPAMDLGLIHADNGLLRARMTGEAIILGGNSRIFLSTLMLKRVLALGLVVVNAALVVGILRKLWRRPERRGITGSLTLAILACIGVARCSTGPDGATKTSPSIPTGTSSQVRLVVIEPEVKDLGISLKELGYAEASFTVRNVTSEPVRLSEAGPACGCDHTRIPEVVPAGEAREITIKTNLGGARQGPWEVTLSLLARSPSGAEQRVSARLKTFIQPGIHIDPPTLLIPMVASERHVTRRVLVRIPTVWPPGFTDGAAALEPRCESKYQAVRWHWHKLPDATDYVQFELELHVDMDQLRRESRSTGSPWCVAPLVTVRIHSLQRELACEVFPRVHPVASGPTDVHWFGWKAHKPHTFCVATTPNQPQRIARVECGLRAVSAEVNGDGTRPQQVTLRRRQGEAAPEHPGPHELLIYFENVAEPFRIKLHLY